MIGRSQQQGKADAMTIKIIGLDWSIG